MFSTKKPEAKGKAKGKATGKPKGKKKATSKRAAESGTAKSANKAKTEQQWWGICGRSMFFHYRASSVPGHTHIQQTNALGVQHEERHDMPWTWHGICDKGMP